MLKPTDDPLQDILQQLLEMSQKARRKYSDKGAQEAYLDGIRAAFKVVQGVRSRGSGKVY